jgi:hypothetical protein
LAIFLVNDVPDEDLAVIVHRYAHSHQQRYSDHFIYDDAIAI